METSANYKFYNRGQFASAGYDETEEVLAEYGHGNWKIATMAETLQFSPIAENAFFWTSTKNIFTSKGIIVYDDPERKMPSNEKELMKLHKSGDPAVRFVKHGFEKGKMSVAELVKNPLVIAQMGNKDLMDIVAQRARGISPECAYVMSDYLEGNLKEPVRLSAVDSWGVCGQFLHIYYDVGRDMHGAINGYMRKVEN